jgi:hypothetical protein
MVRHMLLVALFAGLLLVLLIVGDWIHFTSLSMAASQYGCGIAKKEDRLPAPTVPSVEERFDRDGVLTLPHGVARLFHGERRILLRPHYRLFSYRFRTAWPVKGTIDVAQDGHETCLTCTKRIPWSSAVMTLLWFTLVGGGTVWFLVAYAMQGGVTTLSGVLVALGVVGLGLLVLAFGLVTVAFAYRLENDRLVQAYMELRAALLGEVRREA